MSGSRFFNNKNHGSNKSPPFTSPEELTELRKKYLEECAPHESFLCLISWDILKEPVITTEGRVYSKAMIQDALNRQIEIQNAQIQKEIESNIPVEQRREKIGTYCPVTTNSLTFSNLHSFLELENLVNQYELINKNILQHILAMTLSDEEIVKSQITLYKEEEKKLVMLMESFKRRCVLNFKNKVEIVDDVFQIANIKNKFKININDIDHLAFWDQQTKKCFHSKGGVVVIHKPTNSPFRVPTRIAAIMQIAEKIFDNPSSLIEEIKRLRISRPSFFNNPFSFLTRSELTKKFYETELENLDLRSNGFAL